MNASFETDTSFPPKPVDYHLNLPEMLADSGNLKVVASWFAFSSAILSIFFNFLVLFPVTKRLKRHWNIDMMLVSIILTIDLIYGFWIITQHITLIATSFTVFESTAFVQINGFVLPLLIMASLFMVSILSLERYMFTVKGVRWTSTSYYLLAAGYLAPPILLGLVGAVTGQFMPMPSCTYSLILIDKSSFAPIYLGFFTVQSIIAGLVFNSSYLAILFHHRKILLIKSKNFSGKEDQPTSPKKSKSKGKVKNKNQDQEVNEVLSLPDMLGQPLPKNFNKFQLRSKDQSKSLANTLLYKTLVIMIIYDIICLPEVIALVYESFTLQPRPISLDFISVLFVSNHALISPLVVMFLHQQTKEDLLAFRQDIRTYLKKLLGWDKLKGNNGLDSSKLDLGTSLKMKELNLKSSLDTDTSNSLNHSRSESQRFDRSVLSKPSTLFENDDTNNHNKELNKDDADYDNQFEIRVAQFNSNSTKY